MENMRSAINKLDPIDIIFRTLYQKFKNTRIQEILE